MNQEALNLWKQRIIDKKNSELSFVEWCTKNNLTRHTYYYWLRSIEANGQNDEALKQIFVEIEPAQIILKQMEKSELNITWKDINLRACLKSCVYVTK
ncbi:MAG TPA: hypothetical protein DHV55_08455 [Clostridiaceae bacterium]|nr:hypothetical protein [Clostridiaceae bacterium]